MLGVRSVGAGRCLCGSLEILVVLDSVYSDRFHYTKPFVLVVDSPNLTEGFVDIRHGGNEGSSLADGAAYRLPIERIPPAIVRIPGTAGALQDFQEVHRPVVILLPVHNLSQKSESHGVVGICYWKSLSLPKEWSSRRKK